jgi:hypothetical protein
MNPVARGGFLYEDAPRRGSWMEFYLRRRAAPGVRMELYLRRPAAKAAG